MERASIEEIRQRELIEATLRMVSEVGFDGVTTRNVAREAGASLGSVHYYFSNKDELLRAAIAYSERKWREYLAVHLEDVEGAIAKLHRVVELCFPGEGAEPDPTWNLFIDFWQVASKRRDVAQVLESGTASWLELLTRILDEGMASRELRVQGTPRNEAMRLAAMIDGLAIHTRVAPYLTEAAARDLLLEWIEELSASTEDATTPAAERDKARTSR